LKAKINEIDLEKLEKRFRDTAFYDVSEAAIIKKWEYFFSLVKKEIV